MTISGLIMLGAKRAARRLHWLVSRRRWTAQLYLRFVSAFCKRMPDAGWKNYVANSLRSVSWPDDLSLPPAEVKLQGSDLRIRLVPHIAEFDLDASLFQTLPYEAPVFQWLAGRDYDTVIDIGANVGVYSLYLAKRLPGAAVYAFEPSRKAYRRLLDNVDQNDCPNLHSFNCGIYDSSGFLTFHEPAGHLTNGSLDPSFAGIFSTEVLSSQVVMLDASTLEPLCGRGPVLIKVDAEGAEPAILRALGPLIERHSPDLLIEVLPHSVDALNALPLVRDGRYRLLHLQPGGAVERPRLVATDHRDYAFLAIAQ